MTSALSVSAPSVTVPQEDRLQAGLLEIWKRLLNLDELGLDDDFFEKGGDSLLATEMVTEAEQRLGISIPESLLLEASSIRHVAAAFARAPEMEKKPVYSVTSTAGVPPLLFFHGDWTHGGFYLRQFARALGPDLPLAAVAPHGLRGEPILGSLEAMAADRLPHILAFQPHGPYRLGGHCVGGMVAMELARLLAAQGREVEVVAMIDPLWTAAGQPYPQVDRPPEAEESDRAATRDLPDMRMTPESAEQYGRALDVYAPGRLDVPLLAFSCKFDARPWQKVSRDFTLVEMPGGHYDLVTLKAGAFAAHLRERVKGAVVRSSARL